MKTEASLLSAIASAPDLRTQIRLAQELDAFRAQRTASVQADRDLDLGAQIEKQTLTPVRTFERHTASTDWLDEVLDGSIDKTAATNQVHAEAALWYSRTAGEVKADAEEFAEQARGQARRTAGAYGVDAAEMERAYLDYVAFLYRREGASGLDQIQQTIDGNNQPKTTPLPTDVFDTYEEPVDPMNAGVDEQQSSYNAPLMNEIMSNNGEGGPGVPSQHSTDNVKTGPQTNGSGFPVGSATASLQAEASVEDEDWGVPTVAINHVMNLDQFIASERERASRQPEPRPFAEGPAAPKVAADAEHRGSADEVGRFVDGTWEGRYNTRYHSKIPQGHVWESTLHGPGGQPIHTLVRPDGQMHDITRPTSANPSGGDHHMMMGKRTVVGRFERQAGSGLDQVEQTIDANNQVKPTPLPTEVMWPLDENGNPLPQGGEGNLGDRTPVPSRHETASKEAATKCSCAKHGDGSVTTSLCPQHADHDPCATMAAVTGERRKGSIKGGTCTNCGWTSGKTASKTADMYGGGDAPHAVPGAPVQSTPADYDPSTSGSFADGQAAGRRDAGDPKQRPTFSDASSHANDYVRGYVDGWQSTPRPQARHDVPPSVSQDRTKGNDSDLLNVAAGLVSQATLESRDFKKGYRYASKWKPGQRIVRRGSVEFESGLYAGMLVNSEQSQVAWTKAHAKWGAKEEFFLTRIAQHAQFTAMRAQAATSTDLETMEPGLDNTPTEPTNVSGPGTVPPLDGGMDPAAPGGAAPYNGAAPYSSPAAPDPAWVDPHKMSAQATAFRQAVQANLLKEAAEPKNTPVCRGCGEAFENRQVATEAHGKNGCGTEPGERGYEMKRESEAW